MNPDPEDESGRTPLFFAALFGKEIIVKMLLETGKVNPECEDCFGWTPLQCAQKKKKKKKRHQTIVDMLCKYMNDKDDTDMLYNTFARSTGDILLPWWAFYD